VRGYAKDRTDVSQRLLLPRDQSGNARAEVFHAEGDYQAFVTLLKQASERVPMRLLAYSLMPNHFHLAFWPYRDGDLSRWMQ
jgi:putative transposase